MIADDDLICAKTNGGPQGKFQEARLTLKLPVVADIPSTSTRRDNRLLGDPQRPMTEARLRKQKARRYG